MSFFWEIPLERGTWKHNGVVRECDEMQKRVSNPIENVIFCSLCTIKAHIPPLKPNAEWPDNDCLGI